jgi:FkbM family methyltransferase
MDSLRHWTKKGLATLGYEVRGTRYCARQLLDPECLRAIEFDDVVCRRMFESGPELNFIQIGAFDGITGDPLRKYIDKCGWTGVLVEPQARAAEKLRTLYHSNNRIVVLQAALHGELGMRRLLTVNSVAAPHWVGGLASFHSDIITKHSDLIPGLQAMIKEESVDCITFDKVLGCLPRKPIDILQIDTEGADAYILSLFPFHLAQPSIIHWEVKHLSKAQQEDTLEMLRRFGYRLARSGSEDMLAVLE